MIRIVLWILLFLFIVLPMAILTGGSEGFLIFVFFVGALAFAIYQHATCGKKQRQ
jgi:hypothetical protein